MNKQSRFGPSHSGPPNNYGSTNLMDLKTGKPRNYGENVFSQQNFGSIPTSNFKTPEQLAFDNEFAKWEQSFKDWKKSYANHPDRNAYREYESKFLTVREKLMEKRKQIYGENNRASSFDNHLYAADAMANSILSKFDEPKDFRNDDKYRGGYSHDGRSIESYPMISERDDRLGGNINNNRSRDDRSGDNFRGRDNNNRGRDSNMRGGNRNNRGRDNNMRGGNRNDRGAGGRFGGDDKRNNFRIQKPTDDQIMKELRRRDVYPHTKWVLIIREDRPPLVGKRAKKKNAKILNVIETQRKSDSSEIALDQLPWPQRVERLFETARNAELPKLLSGNANKRRRNLQNKREEDLTEDERRFLAYCNYVQVKRAQYFEKKKQEEGGETLMDQGTSH